jgi:hypothetical protein
MLKRLVSIVAEREILSTRDLSQELHISEDLVSQLFLDLTRLGFLESVGNECVSPCGNCPTRESCIQARAPVLWRLTNKGALSAQVDPSIKVQED